MITEITFDKIEKAEEEGGEDNYEYEFLLPSLNGRTFRFKPNLNVIVGKNGCGKTSLLNVMRALTFTTKMVYGKFKGFGQIDASQDYFAHARMTANYKYGFFNYMNVRELRDCEVQDSFYNFSRFYETNNGESAGEARMSDIESLIDMFIRNGEADESEEARSFKKTVVEQLERRRGDSCPEIEDILKYYQEHHDEKARGWTFFFDEPDAGLDVDNLESVYRFLVNVDTSPNPLQYICVIHNVALIRKLMKAKNVDGTPKVNFIELSEGYLKQVEYFLKEGE